MRRDPTKREQRVFDLEAAINSELAQTGARFTVEIDETFNMRHGAPGTPKLPVSLASGYQKFALGLAAPTDHATKVMGRLRGRLEELDEALSEADRALAAPTGREG